MVKLWDEKENKNKMQEKRVPLIQEDEHTIRKDSFLFSRQPCFTEFDNYAFAT